MTKNINEIIYLDNAATTPLHPKVLEAMMPYLTTEYGNPSAVYSFARNARKAVEKSREQIAEAINCSAKEIIFTSSGTEANNWVLKNMLSNGGHIITSAVEHHAISEVCKSLEKNGKTMAKGVDVTYLPVDSQGNVLPESLVNAIRPDTVLISMMWANNEIGTIFPIAELAEIAKEKGIAFHTDAVQAVGHIPVDMSKVPVDLLTLSAHKFYGPKGVGALFIRRDSTKKSLQGSNKLKPLFFGGAQEKNQRAGTENVAGIVGMGEALALSVMELDEEYKRISALRDKLIDRIEKEIPCCFLNGARGDGRLPGNINFSFDYIEGESLLLLLDMNGICASSGSACSSASLEPSHVIMALGVPHEKAHGSIRFSLGRNNSQSDIDKLMEVLPKLIHQLRAMSPLAEGDASWNTMTK